MSVKKAVFEVVVTYESVDGEEVTMNPEEMRSKLEESLENERVNGGLSNDDTSAVDLSVKLQKSD